MSPTSAISWRPCDHLTPAQDRAAGAVMGVLIGDAMAVGPHRYYDLDEMRQAYGGRITDYVPVLPNRYHVGVEWRTEGFVSFAETSEAEQRAVVIAARYANDLMQAGRLSADCAKFTQQTHQLLPLQPPMALSSLR